MYENFNRDESQFSIARLDALSQPPVDKLFEKGLLEMFAVKEDVLDLREEKTENKYVHYEYKLR